MILLSIQPVFQTPQFTPSLKRMSKRILLSTLRAHHALHEVSPGRDGPFELGVSQRVKQPQKNHRLIVDRRICREERKGIVINLGVN